jgi:hypothetical protein
MSLFRLTQRITCRVSNAKNIVIEYSDLKSGKNLTDLIEKAYGPQGKIILYSRTRNFVR